MRIIRRNEYIAMPVRLLRDGELSIRAKGMLGVLFTMRDDTAITEYDLCAACRVTLEDMLEITQELEKAGFLIQEDGIIRLFDAPQNDREL